MKTIKKSLFTIMVISLFPAFLGCGAEKESKSEEHKSKMSIASQIIPVEVEKVKLGSIASVIIATGNITPFKESKIGPKMSGRCEKIYVDEGDHIEKGDVLIKLDQSSLIIARNQAQASLATAKASLNKILAGTRQELIEQAEAELSRAKANLDWSQEEFDRIENLYNRRVVAKKAFDSTKMQLQVAQAQYRKAKEHLEMAQKGATQEDIEVARAQVNQAEVALQMAEQKLRDSVIEAPFSGVVVQKFKNEGEYITSTPATPILFIMNIHKVNVEVGIPEDKIKDLHLRQRVEIRVDGYPGEVFQGKVSLISPMIDSQSRTFKVKVEISNPDYKLKAGMYARVKITLIEKKEVPIISRDGIIRRDGVNYVMLANKKKAKEKKIRIGLTHGNRVEVLEGVKPGDLVIVSGQQSLKSGMLVKITRGVE